MWQENPSRRSQSPTFSSSRKERSRSQSPHQCQIRRLYRAIESIETPHLDSLRNRSPRSPSERFRGTLGGCEPIMVMEEKQVRETACEDKEIGNQVPAKAAKLLGRHDDMAQQSRERRNHQRRIPGSPPDSPLLRECFELDGDHSPLVTDTRKRSLAELEGSPVFSSISWSGEHRHELPVTPTTPTVSRNKDLKPQPLRLSKSSICMATVSGLPHDSAMDRYKEWITATTIERDLKSRRSSQVLRNGQPRPISICTSQPAPSSTATVITRTQGLRKVKARHDLRIAPTNLLERCNVPAILVTNPTIERSRRRSRGEEQLMQEKAEEAGFREPWMTEIPKEESKWEEITEAAELKLCMAVLAKEIARRKMEMTLCP